MFENETAKIIIIIYIIAKIIAYNAKTYSVLMKFVSIIRTYYYIHYK